MRTAVFGAEGMLGRDLLEVLGPEGVGLGHADADIVDADAVARALDRAAPEAVVLAAAFHDVPRCEREPEPAFRVNAVGALNVARAAAARGLKLLFVGTDYVFSGEKGAPYVEDDLPAPVNVYGVAKLAAEHATLEAHPGAIVARTCGLYGVHPCRAKKGHHIVEFILGRLERGEPLKMVADEFACPTSTISLARQIVALLERGGAGIYHAVNGPGGSWYDFARAAARAAGLPGEAIEKASAATFPSPVRKPRDSRLACARLAAEGLLVLDSTEAALAEHVARRRAARSR